MKKLSLLLFLIFNVACGFSQTSGDNVIIVKDFLPQNSLKNIKRILITNGYELLQMDTTEKYFSTHPHPIEGLTLANDVNVKIMGFIEENDLILSAYYTCQYYNSLGLGNNDSGRATFKNVKILAERHAFDELQRIALKISTNLVYLKE
jgi:hypothetical protein